MNKKVLFIGHYAGTTGAPIILLRLLQWLKANTNVDFEILLNKNGLLRPSYEMVAPTFLYDPRTIKSNPIYRFFNTIVYRFGCDEALLNKRLKIKYSASSFNLIFSNTITNGAILSALSYLKCPVICRVAELEYWINKAGKMNFDLVKNHVTHFITVSEAVKNNLIFNHNIPSNKIDVIPGFITPPVITTSSDNIRHALKIPKNAIVVGSSGMETWRKGKDLFIQLALIVLKRCKDLPIYFIWVGGNKEGMDFYQIQHDIRQAGLVDRIRFVPQVSNPLDYYGAFDVFALLSREDPYPIANLEAASLSKPIVCFENAGGSPEFVEDDAGFVVPYLDVNAMADKVITLAKDKELMAKLGNSAAQKVRERHDISVAAPKILEVINRFLRPS